MKVKDSQTFKKEHKLANISDIIEQFILDTMGNDNALNLSRNDLAAHFSCAPSQINYVLTTRFSPSRGFLIESQRGGGGFVRLIKLDVDNNEYVNNYVISQIGKEVSYKDACYILQTLTDAGLINKQKQEMAQILLQDKALSNPFRLEDSLRANMLKNLIYNAIKEEDWCYVKNVAKTMQVFLLKKKLIV